MKRYLHNSGNRRMAIQQMDMQIAAIALVLSNGVVVSKDTDFNDIPGLADENWAVP